MGYTTYTCACGHSYIADLTAATGHNHTAVVTLPNCTEMGYTTYTCACGDTYKADYVSATGHTEEIIPAVDPTFNTVGSTEGVKCSVCGKILVAPVEIPQLNVAQIVDKDGKVTYFSDVSDALAAATGGDTVILLANGQTKAMLMIPAGVTFNLNGKTITAGNVMSFGNVIDNVIDNDGSTDGLGGIIISNDRTKAFVQLQQNNTYLPLYDAANDCYRFYAYELSVLKYEVVSDSAVTFEFRLRLSTEAAYRLLADAANSGVELSLQLTVDDGTKTTSINYVLSAEKLAEYVNGAIEQIENGEKTAMKVNKTIKFTLTGLDSLGSGTVITATPTISTEVGVEYEKVVDDSNAGLYTEYIIP